MSDTAGARAGSAPIGDPPNNQVDFYIVRGLYRTIGVYSANASAGYVYAAKKPDHAVQESKQTAVIVGMVIVILAIVVPTVARLVVRLRGNQTRFGSDDWAIIAAASLTVVYPCLQIATVVNNGAGRHIWEATYVDYNQYAYNLGICQVIFYVAVGLIKLSIALFVRRLTNTLRAWRIFVDVFIGTLIIYIGMAIFWWAFLCSPPRARWDRLYSGSLDSPAKCADGLIQVRVLSSMHVAQGMILLASPIIILWHTRIDTFKKARLFFIWLVGGTSVVGGLLQQTTTTVTNDAFWQYTDILRWTSLDLALGVVVASLPVLDAAIIGGLSTVGSKLGGSYFNSHSHSTLWVGINTNTKTTIKGANKCTESVEHIISRERGEGTELNIVRTDEVQVSYDKRADGHNQLRSHHGVRYAKDP